MRDARYVKVADDLERVLPAAQELRFEHGAFGEHRDLRPGHGPARAVSPREDNTLGGRTMVEVILFGKIHYVGVEEFKRQASAYAVSLLAERDLLADYVNALRRIEDEWRGVGRYNPFSWIVSGNDAPDRVLDALSRVLAAVPDPRPDPHSEALRETGIVLHQVRTAIARLRTDLTARREHALERAEQAARGAELVEDTAFQALLQASMFVPALRDPVTEFGYRISVVCVEATARAGGAWMADAPVWREVFAVAKARVPQVLVDTFMSVVRAYLGPGAGLTAAGVAQREWSLVIVQQIVEFGFDVATLAVQGPPPGMKPDAVLVALAEKRLVSVLGLFLGRVMGFRADDTRLKHIVKLVIESVVVVAAQEINAVAARAADEGRPPSEIILSEAPWLLARIVQNVLLGMLRHAQVDPHATDRQPLPPSPAARMRDTLKLIGAQARNRRMIFAGGAAGPLHARPPGVDRPPPLRWEAFNAAWKRLGLSRPMLHTMLRSVDDGGAIIEARVTNPDAARHFTEPGVSMKPAWCKPKTARLGGVTRGLVTRPSQETHGDRLREAQAAWDKGTDDLKAHGALVRPGDGVVFHPDQLVEWSRALPSEGWPGGASDRAFVRGMAEKLRGAPEGAFELDSAAGLQWMRGQFAGPGEHERALSLLARARVGFTGDTDLVAVFDAPTGRIAPVGERVRLPGAPAMQQNADRLRALNLGAGAMRVGEGQETDLGKIGRATFQHGGAAERFNDDGTLEFAGLGEVYGLTRGEHGFVRWTVDVARRGGEELSVPAEMVPRLPRGLRVEGSVERFASVRGEALDTVFERVFREMNAIPEAQRGSAFGVVARLGLTHLDSAHQQRFAEALHARMITLDPAQWDVAKVHLADALTLTRLQQLREIHRELNRSLLERHARSPTFNDPVVAASERRRQQPRPGRLTKLRRADRPRVDAGQVGDAEPEGGHIVGPRSIEAGLLARGLTLLAPETARDFEGVVDVADFAAACNLADASRVTVGVDASRGGVVVATFADDSVGDAVGRMHELARSLGLDRSGATVWWELHRAVLPVSTTYVSGQIDRGDAALASSARGALSGRWTAAETRAGMRLVAFRVRRPVVSYPGANDEREAFVGAELDEVWWSEARATLLPRKSRLLGRPVAVFLGGPVSVPEDGPRVSRPLDADRADLRTVSGYQRALHLLGYLEKTPDGALDAETRDAIGAFQADADTALSVDCVVGSRTRAALRDALRALEIDE